MNRYYVNQTAQANGDHEVHKVGCQWLAKALYTIDLGLHSNCQSAVTAAKRLYPTANGCAYCSPQCHTR